MLSSEAKASRAPFALNEPGPVEASPRPVADGSAGCAAETSVVSPVVRSRTKTSNAPFKSSATKSPSALSQAPKSTEVVDVFRIRTGVLPGLDDGGKVLERRMREKGREAVPHHAVCHTLVPIAVRTQRHRRVVHV